MSQGTEFHGHAAASAHPGRHRRGGAESWTPPLPQHRPVRHRAAGAAPEPGFRPPEPGAAPTGRAYALPQQAPGRPPAGGPFARRHPAEPAECGFSGRLAGPEVDSHPFRAPAAPPDPPVSGLLPLPQPRDRRPAAPLFPAAHGSLPLDAFEDPEPDEPPVVESHAEQVARRTRVSLAAPAPRCVDVDEEDVRIYSAPPLDGLGGFTIGSVPASVTPPKTWRKAAWFATGASGAVVVGLLCAGSFLVGKPPMDQAVQGSWPGYQGVPTLADPTGEHRPPTQGGSAAGPESTSRTDDDAAGRTAAGGGAGPVDDAVPPPTEGTTETGTPTTGPAGPSAAPRKPPVTPAQRETPVKPPWWYSFPPDAQTMGDNSEKFFNTVTTDPAAASSVTTGRLHDQGPQALAERYAGIAYFEVKKVSIDQQRGVTVNTLEVTHTDGTKTIEQRTLTFGDGDKITADGQ
ncbi:hypothetical protein [Amycolatopsis sp. NPDC004169]|uniref:hypothetical protein n=1 Tax=Amycolatopsis sp. NPDC004169 TaxID=3154453 RepID=UPI0033BA3655